MPSPRDGTAGLAVAPAEPRKPYEADRADPGQVAKLKADQRRTGSGKYGSVQTKPYKPPTNGTHSPSGANGAEADRKHWIEIELVDRQNQPVPGEPYRIILPDGRTIAEGTLDEKGFTRVDGIDPGVCRITFPDLDKQAWRPK